MAKKEITFKFTVDESMAERLKEVVTRSLDRNPSIVTPFTSLDLTENIIDDEEEFFEETNYVALINDDDYMKDYFGFFDEEKKDMHLLYASYVRLTENNKLNPSLYELNKGYGKIFNIKDNEQVKKMMTELVDNYRYRSVKLCKVKRTDYKVVPGHERLYFTIRLEEMENTDKRADYIIKYNLKNNYVETMKFLKTDFVSRFRENPIFDVVHFNDIFYKLLRKNIKEMKNIKYADKGCLIDHLKCYLFTKTYAYRLCNSEYSHSKESLDILNETLSSFLITDDELKIIIDDLFSTNKHKDFYYEMFKLFTTDKFINLSHREVRLYVFLKLGVITEREIEIYKTTKSRFIKDIIEYFCVISFEDFINKDLRKSESWNLEVARRLFINMSSFSFYRELTEGVNEEERELYFEILEIRLRRNIAIKELGQLLNRYTIVDQSDKNRRTSDLLLKVILEELDREGETNKMLLKSVLKKDLVIYSEGRDDHERKIINISSLDLRNYKNLRKELMNIKLS